MSRVARLRSLVLRRIDRSPVLRSAITGPARQLAVRRGADPTLIGLVSDDDLPLDRELQALQWAVALGGSGDPPRSFSPGDHFTSSELRSAACDALRRTSLEVADLHLIGLDDDLDLNDLGRAIETDLSELLTGAGGRPGRGAGLAPERQTALAVRLTSTLVAGGIEPFLMSGSLLGVIRDGDFMAHDYDIDLGVVPGVDLDHVEMLLADDTGLRIGRHGPRLEIRDESDTVADIFAHEERGGLWWHATLIHEWWNTPFSLVPLEVGANEFFVPDDPERYLDENYGDWSHPVPFYDISFDTPNREYVRGPLALRFLHSRVRQAMVRGDRWLAEAAARELRDTFGVDVTDTLASSPLLSNQSRFDSPGR